MNFLFQEFNKTKMAKERIEAFKPKGNEPFYLAFSGGKDSVVMLSIIESMGYHYEAAYAPTTVDPPQLVRFIKQNFPGVNFEKPETTMWKLIIKKLMPPTRKIRYCCEIFKEKFGKNRTVLLGIRAEESAKRSKYQIVEKCVPKGKLKVMPIIDWLSWEIWQEIEEKKLPYCNLYDLGFKRIGCIGCPMNRQSAQRDFKMFPKYKKKYLKAFDEMLKEREKKELPTDWKNSIDVYRWWIGGQKRLTGTLFTEDEYSGGY